MRDEWTIIIDFDGTLTETDTELFVATKMLPGTDARLKKLFDAYESIEIGLLEYFHGYLELVDIESNRFLEIVAETPMRDDLVRLVLSLEKRIPLIIVSEGLDVYIKPLLDKHGLGNIPLVCNRVVKTGNRHRIVAADGAESCDRCLSCKGALVRRMKQQRKQKVAVIGNGASDFCAAKEADATFARDRLEALCRQNGVACTHWSDAEDIALFFLP